MSIRTTLLRAFLLVGLAPAILLAGLAFVKARSAMQAEIEQSLAAQADAIASDIDKTMFERLQNAATWSQLDVMQDLKVQDVDRRLANFLAKLASGYGGVYRELYAVSHDGRIVSSSAPAHLGTQPAWSPAWRSLRLAGTQLVLQTPQHDADAASLAIRAPVASQFGDGRLGELVLIYDWGQIDALLDRAASGGRMLALADGDGHVLAASQALRAAGLLRGTPLAGWQLQHQQGGALLRDGAPMQAGAVIVGLGHARGFAGLAGLGLTTLVIQPQDEALAPVHRMALIFLSLLAALSLATVLVAGWVSGAIARPIQALTAFTRRYRREQAIVDPPLAGCTRAGEVGELAEAFVQMMRDIDLSQRKLVRASKLAVVGEMSSVIAHEVRTPLGILRSSAQMLRREPGLSEEGRELMGFIESETERLNRLVSAMLDSARPRAPSRVSTDLHGVIHQGVVLLGAQAEKRQIRIGERLEAADPMVDCDAEQMTQVLLNLILNGLQILQPGGQILIGTRDTAEEFVIEIADDGPGIPVEERARVFEAFFFRREGGVGLGLAIVQQIVAAHDGDIEAAESALGGALFLIRLPRHAARQLDNET